MGQSVLYRVNFSMDVSIFLFFLSRGRGKGRGGVRVGGWGGVGFVLKAKGGGGGVCEEAGGCQWGRVGGQIFLSGAEIPTKMFAKLCIDWPTWKGHHETKPARQCFLFRKGKGQLVRRSYARQHR